MERAATYEALRAAIARAYPELSRQLQHIARFATEHPNDMALETVATIAGRAAVPPSSLVRFAQALGFDGFSDMQQVFRSRLVERSLSYRERIARLTRDGAAGGPPAPADVLARFVDEAVTGLRHMADAV
ncbi:MAG TPA: MurR/RpiR family transcriptional regulator, partial [Methylomirabilota bacterium]|nr:MurR/RpiR family transcriptional regulator [Methylomirabilota bacterium]